MINYLLRRRSSKGLAQQMPRTFGFLDVLGSLASCRFLRLNAAGCTERCMMRTISQTCSEGL